MSQAARKTAHEDATPSVFIDPVWAEQQLFNLRARMAAGAYDEPAEDEADEDDEMAMHGTLYARGGSV